MNNIHTDKRRNIVESAITIENKHITYPTTLIAFSSTHSMYSFFSVVTSFSCFFVFIKPNDIFLPSILSKKLFHENKTNSWSYLWGITQLLWPIRVLNTQGVNYIWNKLLSPYFSWIIYEHKHNYVCRYLLYNHIILCLQLNNNSARAKFMAPQTTQQTEQSPPHTALSAHSSTTAWHHRREK